MKSSRFVITGSISALVVIALALALPAVSLASSTITELVPASVTQVPTYGTTSGSLADLASVNGAFVTMQTPTNKAYRADYAFALPGTIYRNNIQTLQLAVTYRGQTKKQELWTWLIFNKATNKWVTLGTNTTVVDANWTSFTFNLPSGVPMDYINKDTRNILVRVQSKNGKYDADLDRMEVVIDSLNAEPAPTVGPCSVFPTNNVWNARIDKLPVDKNSAKYIASIGKNTGLHPDFDAVGDGIPYNTATNASTVINFSESEFDYGDESDTGNYPVPAGFLQENGGDAHILTTNKDTCKLYELYAADINGANSTAGSGAIFNLLTNDMRQDGWTSADAAGLPIFPGLARIDQVQNGRINHALRFTANKIRDSYVWPASHHAGCGATATNKNVAPMGTRFRLKASVDISGYAPQTQVVLTALKEYGMILADCGSNWYISGEPADTPGHAWDDENLVPELRSITGSMFEAVDESSLQLGPDSYAVAP